VIAAEQDFAALPGAVARELGSRRRVVVVLLDAFGWAFAQRHARHPLLARMAADGTLAPLASQFPSTTTAHVTTMHTGLPVGAHGLYEWRVWEPSLGRIVIPLLDALAPLPQGPSFYQRLAARGIPSMVFSPDRFSPSAYDRAAVRGVPLSPYGELPDGARALAAAVAAQDRCYAYLYWDRIDAVGHRHGPSSPEFDDACLRALDAVFTAFFGPDAPALEDTLLVLTADHGQIDVAPERIDFVDEAWPGLTDVLTTGPAGSARDLFLHVREDAVEASIGALSAALGDRASVHRSEELFAGTTIGPRLRERLAPVCVLPAPGRMAWLAAAGDDLQLRFRGHHGGRTSEEATSVLGTIELS
jgi:hypothetical protein